jgi:hypothetical protein
VKTLSLIAGVAAMGAIALGAGPASAATVQCKVDVYKNQTIYVTSARGMTCAAAAREQRRYTWTGKNTFRTPGGFSCKPSGRGKLGYQIRCTKGSSAYRIEFID